MSQHITTKANGLYSFPNHMSSTPEGALTDALNVIIDRNNIIEPRRGLSQYGDTFGVATDRAHQIISYKDRLLIHYDSKIAYDSDGLGTYADFAGTYDSASFRIKSLEANSNLYFTSSEGIKKLSADSSDFSTLYIENSGGIKALDITSATIDYGTSGFMSGWSNVAYKIVWGITDVNKNLILGSPSSRTVVENISETATGIVDLTFPVPSSIEASADPNYFYQVYRTGVFTYSSLDELNLVGDPGDEMYLVAEYFYDGIATEISYTDVTPESIREGGALLYTNPVSGEGVLQANEIPPFSKDIASFKGYTFFGNTSTIQRLNTAQISVVDLTTVTSSVSITDGTTTNTYNYSGTTTTTIADFSGLSASVLNYDNDYILLNSASNEREYLIWLNDLTTGTSPEPSVSGKLNIQVDYTSTSDTPITLAAAVKTAVESYTFDFNITDDGAGELTIVTANNGLADDLDITNASTLTGDNFAKGTYTAGTGEDVSTKKIFLPRVPLEGEYGPSTAQQIDQAARSLVKNINGDSASVVDAYYISTSTDLPGKILLEQKLLTGPVFEVYANSADTGSQFNPALPDSADGTVSSENEVKPNRLYYSKYQQPESVPLVNYIDIGPQDKAIQRIIALRDGLFVFKEDGIYRLTGDVAPFTVSAFDNSAILQAPDSAVVLNNLIYAFTTQGIVSVSDSQVSVISRPIEDKLLSITRSGFDYENISFGVSYETDRSYMFWTLSNLADTVATQCFRYNSFTNTWTIWDVTANCGLVKVDEDKLMIGAGDENFIEKERKTRTRVDYADRDFPVSLIEGEVDGNDSQISSTNGVDAGDVITQTQYLTISQYNRMLRKLQLDTSLDTDYFDDLEAFAGDNMSTKMTNLAIALNLDDTTRITKTFDFTDIITGTDVINVTGHGYIDGDIVYFSSTGTSPTADGVTIGGDNKFYIISANTNDFQISQTSGGAALDILTQGTGTHTVSGNYYTSGSVDFATIQTDYNNISEQLGLSSGVFFVEYPTSSGTVTQEGVILDVAHTPNVITTSNSIPFVSGIATIYKAINTKITWDSMFFQDPSIMKHVREGTIFFEDNNFTSAIVSYSTDLSPSFDEVPFLGSGSGDWGQFSWGTQNWGGISAAKPLRTLIPLQKQRCRYISPRFEHKNAFEKYSVLGLSLTFRALKERAYK